MNLPSPATIVTIVFYTPSSHVSAQKVANLSLERRTIKYVLVLTVSILYVIDAPHH